MAPDAPGPSRGNANNRATYRSPIEPVAQVDFPRHFEEHSGRLYHSNYVTNTSPYPLPCDTYEQTVRFHNTYWCITDCLLASQSRPQYLEAIDRRALCWSRCSNPGAYTWRSVDASP